MVSVTFVYPATPYDACSGWSVVCWKSLIAILYRLLMQRSVKTGKCLSETSFGG